MGNGSSVEPAKVVYIEIMGRQEKIIFSRKCNPRDIDFLLRQAAGIPNNFSKLTIKDRSGVTVPLSSEMPINDPSNYYIVQIKDGVEQDSLVDEDTTHMTDRESIDTAITQVIDQFNRAFRVEELQSDLYSRLKAIEKKFEREALKFLDIDKCKRDIQDLKDLVYSHRNKSPRYAYHTISPLSDDSKISLKRDIPSYPKYTLSKETTNYLKQPTFNMWHWEPNEMLSLMEHMYHELRLVKEFNINPITLKRWLLCVQENYRNNPFHNFRHCFCVTQMMYGFIHLCHLWDFLSTEDLGLLLTACICHDLDHPGYNNTYQINAKTELAIRYNNISPLEHHHCAVAFQILSNQETNLFANVDQNRQKRIRLEMQKLILATDLAKHNEYMEQFTSYLQQFDFNNSQHVSMLKIILVKSCDISNELRPLEVSEPWLDCLLEEYFNQSDREKEMGLPVAPFMDREKVTKPSAQIGFIKVILLPMFEAIAKLFPQLTEVMVKPLIDAHDRYETQKQLNDEP